MEKDSLLLEAASRLWTASDSGVCCAPVRDLIDPLDQESAYRIQKINTDKRIAGGARKIGWKVGLTARSVQKQLGVDQPDFGMLLSDMEVPNGDILSIDQLMQPKVEGEIAFVLGAGLDKEYIGTADVLKSVDFALASLEIVGSRINNWDIKIADTIADNASASHFVLGNKPMPLSQLDLVNCKMSLEINGELVSQGTGFDCMGSPLSAILWLARKLQKLGTPLQAGDVVLSGALGPMAALSRGDKVLANFDQLGQVHLEIS